MFLLLADMITIPDLIRKKRDGGQLSDDEIKAFIQAIKEKTIQDSQTGTNHLTCIHISSFASLMSPTLCI